MSPSLIPGLAPEGSSGSNNPINNSFNGGMMMFPASLPTEYTNQTLNLSGISASSVTITGTLSATASLNPVVIAGGKGSVVFPSVLPVQIPTQNYSNQGFVTSFLNLIATLYPVYNTFYGFSLSYSSVSGIISFQSNSLGGLSSSRTSLTGTLTGIGTWRNSYIGSGAGSLLPEMTPTLLVTGNERLSVVNNNVIHAYSSLSAHLVNPNDQVGLISSVLSLRGFLGPATPFVGGIQSRSSLTGTVSTLGPLTGKVISTLKVTGTLSSTSKLSGLSGSTSSVFATGFSALTPIGYGNSSSTSTLKTSTLYAYTSLPVGSLQSNQSISGNLTGTANFSGNTSSHSYLTGRSVSGGVSFTSATSYSQSTNSGVLKGLSNFSGYVLVFSFLRGVSNGTGPLGNGSTSSYLILEGTTGHTTTISLTGQDTLGSINVQAQISSEPKDFWSYMNLEGV